MGISRYLHSTIVIDDRLYLFGGYDDTQSLQATVWVTDAAPSTGYRFSVCPRMLYPVALPALARWQDKVFVFGGFGDGGVPRQFIQCFNLSTQQWSEIKPGTVDILSVVDMDLVG